MLSESSQSLKDVYTCFLLFVVPRLCTDLGNHVYTYDMKVEMKRSRRAVETNRKGKGWERGG